MDRHYSININVPPEMFLGVEELKQVLQETPVVCNLCGNKGIAGDNSKFSLSKTKGLDEDHVPNLSNFEKREWFRSLDSMYKEYIKIIFDINEFSNPGYSLDFYQFRLELNKHIDTTTADESRKMGFYKIHKIIFENGKTYEVKEKYFFIYYVDNNSELPDKMIINPDEYTAKERLIRLAPGEPRTSLPELIKK
ncbi:MAG: hypothetical protein Q8R96_19155 [Bacteroidota bacterium]|nr:hypothetical protein [Bacteroidota bacterium]